MEFSRFQWRAIPIWGRKENKGDDNSSEISLSSLLSDTLKFPFQTRTRDNCFLPRKVKKKWENRENRRMDKEDDVVLVPADGVCLSVSETYDSDWSIGWFEPHASDFLCDDETDDSFAVLVPCYRNDIVNRTNEHFIEEKNFMEQWLSSLHNV